MADAERVVETALRMERKLVIGLSCIGGPFRENRCIHGSDNRDFRNDCRANLVHKSTTVSFLPAALNRRATSLSRALGRWLLS
jgi:hypothetical protein